MTKTANEMGYEVVEELNYTNIIKLYANEENGTYGDIYTSKESLVVDYPDAQILEGFNFVMKNSGMSPDSSEDWYESAERAKADATALELDMDECGVAPGKNELRPPTHRPTI
jgi:hypothetical protein